MANYFVDSTTGSDSDNGTTMDLAWATLEHALEAGGLSAGDYVWVRRIHVEFSGTPTSDIEPAYNGTAESPIRLIGWPRNTFSITSATWTNGSTTVDLILPASMDREKHCGRYVTAPDGETYLITKITDTNTITIDREYAGATVSSTSGAATIQADEDYATAQAIDDSGWTITKATYNPDADDLPCLDFQNASYQLYLTPDHFYYIANMEFRDSGDSYGIIRFSSQCQVGELRGCLFTTDQNYSMLAVDSMTLFVTRCIFVGSGSGSSQRGIWGSWQAGGNIILKDCAIYSTGGPGIEFRGQSGSYFEGVNIGVEGASGNYDIYIYYSGNLYGRDVKLGGGGTSVIAYYRVGHSRTEIENYNRTLGAHKTFTTQGEITKKDVVAGSGDPEKRSGGADSVVELLYNLSTATEHLPAILGRWTPHVFIHEFEADTSSKSYRYYVQSMAVLTAAQLWIECEYVSAYDDSSEYVIKKVKSDEAITARSGTTDWSQYVEVTGIQPAVASKVRIRLYCRYQHATNKIFIDPKVVIS